MIKQVKEMSTAGFLLIVNVAILVAVGLVFAFIYTIAIDIKNTSTSTNNIADNIAEVFFRQNRTNLIVNEVREVQDDLIEFETATEANRQELANVLVPALQRSFNQTESIDNLTRQILHFERITEEARQNQTETLLPIFFRQFNQTDTLANATNDLRIIIPEAAMAINNVTEAVNFLATNFGPDTGYLERENFQYKQANETAAAMREVLNLLNETR